MSIVFLNLKSYILIHESFKHMIIGIDGNEANVKRKVGVSEFSYELLSQFNKYQVSSIKYQVYLKSQPGSKMPGESQSFKYRVFGPGKAWTQWRLPLDLYLHRPRPDIFFTPSHYSPRFSPIPTVVSVMDLSYHYYPELFKEKDLYQLKNWTNYSVSKAKAIITISKSTKNDIIKLYGIPENQVFVIYPGIKPVFDLMPHIYPMSELQAKYQIDKRFILFVGTIQPRKNIERLIKAYSKLASEKEFHDIKLVIAGKKGWLYESILSTPESLGIKDKVLFLDFVPDEDLPLLYREAVCLCLPSLYEGFGLPILEAMKYECPVITSNVSSMPEAGGEAALYVDPTDVDDIADKMKKIAGSKKLRNELIEKGKKQVSKFSWEKAAKETLGVLQMVARKSPFSS